MPMPSVFRQLERLPRARRHRVLDRLAQLLARLLDQEAHLVGVVLEREHRRRDLHAAPVAVAQLAIDQDPHQLIHLPIGVPHTQRMTLWRTFSLSAVYGYQTSSFLVPNRSITIGWGWQWRLRPT